MDIQCGIINENDVFDSVLHTEKSPIFIISIPITISKLTGKSTTYTGQYSIAKLLASACP